MSDAEPLLSTNGTSIPCAEVLDAALCMMPLHLTVHDREGRILYLNLPVSQALGLDRSAIVGKTWSEIRGRPHDVVEALDDMLRTVFETGRRSTRTLTVPVLTGMREIEVVVTPCFSESGEDVVLAIAVGTDVTEQQCQPTALHANDGRRQRETVAAPPLSARQREVLALIARGYSGKEIARALSISVRTVESHRHEITEKLGVSTRAKLFDYALENGYLR